MSRSKQILQGLEEALAHAKGDKVLKTVIDSQSQKDFDEDSDNPDTIEGKKTKALQYGKPSKNDPRKTPAKPGERKRGSKKNAPDSASKPNPNIKQGKNTTNTLSSMLKEHNAKVQKNGKGYRATMGQLKAVQRRGEGAFSTSHHPSMDRRGWGIARVKAFLYLMYNGRPSNPNYKQDNDLLPKDHPRASKNKKGKAMDITDLEQAWASLWGDVDKTFVHYAKQRSKAGESPEEIVEEAMDMAKANILSLKRHIDSLLPLLESGNTCFAEPWVQGKLNLADDYIKAVHDYALAEQNEDSPEEPEESDSNKLYTREDLMKMKRNQ